jgi:hypothetical protein
VNARRALRSCTRYLAAASVILLIAGSARPASTQTVVPGQLAPANICLTQWGWCHLPSISAPNAVACACLTAQNAWVLGYSKFYPTTATPSLYLRPITLPPSVIK